ncbi:sensor histidine kinase [Oleiharenicola sp. Vm1]|uniref:sensor histidine kinase n=1 Tax=Oleiharenicola sp. Vm1 TaxID=3398393 RepID=UPI0039F55401
MELRARLARDLHDHVIQSIYAAGLGLEAVRGQLSADPFGAEGRIRHCMTNLNETIRTVRSYISDLEPEPPEKRQRFTDAVRALTATMHELWPVEFTLELDDAVAAQLTNVVEIHALQIVRESLSNALRHGRASRILIRLHAAGAGGATLEVIDNGRGFDPVQRMGTGRGLVNLTTRAREMGATLRIESEEGGGTTVRLHLPPREGAV